MRDSEKRLIDESERIGFHVKHHYQLAAQYQSFLRKIGRIEAQLPLFKGEDLALQQRKLRQLKDATVVIDAEILARHRGHVKRAPLGTTYYLDTDGGTQGNSGLSTGQAFRYLDEYTENAAVVAGDILIMKMNVTNRSDNTPPLAFTSDGSPDNPIEIRPDYDNAFSTQVTSAVTYTPTPGSKQLVGSGTVTDVAAGDMVYLSGDDNKLYTYLVETVSGVNVNLFLPYKGKQSGAGNTLFNIGSPPIWGQQASGDRMTIASDFFWKIAGLHIQSTETNGAFGVTSGAVQLLDSNIEMNGAADRPISMNRPEDLYVQKTRLYNYVYVIPDTGSVGHVGGTFKDVLFDGNNVPGSSFFEDAHAAYSNFFFEDSEFKGHADGTFYNLTALGALAVTRINCRNCKFDDTNFVEEMAQQNSDFITRRGVFSEDHDRVIGKHQVIGSLSQSDTTPETESVTTPLRTGGNNFSVKVYPSQFLGAQFRGQRLELFEYDIYADTNSRVYSVYLKPDDVSDWVANPTAAQLFLEADYWIDGTNPVRRTDKSLSLVDFIGNSDWQPIQIVVTPAVAGKLYLRLVYGKPKETARDNIFFFDPKIEIT